jgi:hypothetical protein
MKDKHILLLIFAIFSGIFIYSCVKKPVYPSTPLIGYKDFIRYGPYSNPDSVEVAITFEDEEGDVGLDQSEATGFFRNGNLFLVYYYDSANTGHFAAWDSSNNPLPPFDTLKIGYRVPRVLPPNDNSEPMKGIIYVKLKKPSIKLPSHKRIKYNIYMYDKAMHKSNTVDSGPLAF